MLSSAAETNKYILDRGCACSYNAFAQITAKCSSENHHAYALFMLVNENERIERACYTSGSHKIQYESSSREVQTAIEMYCEFAAGKTLAQVTRAGLADLAADQGHGVLDMKSVDEQLSKKNADDADMAPLRRELGEEVFSLLVGGAVPFVLFSWAALNVQLKRIVRRVLGVGPRDRIRFRDGREMYALLEALHDHPLLDRLGRSLELGVRSLHLNTVDESSMRSAYQRDTYDTFLAEAKERGFLSHFEVV
jgi:hypothetical protein